MFAVKCAWLIDGVINAYRVDLIKWSIAKLCILQKFINVLLQSLKCHKLMIDLFIITQDFFALIKFQSSNTEHQILRLLLR